MNQTAKLLALWGVLLFALYSTSSPAQAGSEPLTLRINDGVAVPGEIFAVVFRTYSPRGLTQGQICLGGPDQNLLSKTGTPILEALVDFEVFSPQGDVTADAVYDANTGTTVLSFQSPSAGVNEVDGPMAVLYYRISASATPGDEFELVMDLADTTVHDAESVPVPLELRSGTLDIESPSAPLELSLEDSAGPLAMFVDLAISTERSLPLDSGSLSLSFDPAWIADDFPQGVEILTDPRYGSVDASFSSTSPGKIQISLLSSDHSFNRLPGEVLSVRLPISTSTTVGSFHQVSFDPSESFLVAATGGTLDLLLTGGSVEILPEQPLFSDGFETGDVSSWTVNAFFDG